MAKLEILLEQMQRQIHRQERKIEALEAAEYNRLNLIYLTDGVTAPSTVAGWALIYVDTADGDLKVKFGDGHVEVIAADT